MTSSRKNALLSRDFPWFDGLPRRLEHHKVCTEGNQFYKPPGNEFADEISANIKCREYFRRAAFSDMAMHALEVIVIYNSRAILRMTEIEKNFG